MHAHRKALGGPVILPYPSVPDRAPDGPPAETPAERAQRKAEKLAQDDMRRLTGWERYRALNDTVEQAHDLIDLADHKARFALLVMGALNAGLYIMGTRTPLVMQGPGTTLPPAVLGFTAFYAAVVLYALIQVLEALRPREMVPVPGTESGSRPQALRSFAKVDRRDPASYQGAWNDVPLGQLNAELALQAHALSDINAAKFAALRRLYASLQVMVLLGGVVLGGLFVQAAGRTQAPAGAATASTWVTE